MYSGWHLLGDDVTPQQANAVAALNLIGNEHCKQGVAFEH